MEVYVEYFVDTVVLGQAFQHINISSDNYFTSALYSSVAIPEVWEAWSVSMSSQVQSLFRTLSQLGTWLDSE